jgi:predicted metal-binding protein
MADQDYIVVVQCDITMERCSGFLCEKAFTDRSGGFKDYPIDASYRTLYMTCGGCCGKAVHRKLNDLVRMLKKADEIDRSRIVVHLASCITKDNYHGLPCPYLDYLEATIAKLNLTIRRDTYLSKKSEKRRKKGLYSV